MPFISCMSVFWRIANPALPARMGLTSRRYIIRSTVVLAVLAVLPFDTCTEDGAVIRCPECSAEIDVDEDEVEEGELLSCPDGESDLEVSQVKVCHLNVISGAMDDQDAEDDKGAEPRATGIV